MQDKSLYLLRAIAYMGWMWKILFCLGKISKTFHKCKDSENYVGSENITVMVSVLVL